MDTTESMVRSETVPLYGADFRLVARIVSGGQTGADRGGLDAARAVGLPHGGWCPKGRQAEDGTIPLHYPAVKLRLKPTSACSV